MSLRYVCDVCDVVFLSIGCFLKLSMVAFASIQGDEERIRPLRFPRAARRMDTLNDLLAASDVISLHCALTDNTVQILNAECLQHIKPGTDLSCLFAYMNFFLD